MIGSSADTSKLVDIEGYSQLPSIFPPGFFIFPNGGMLVSREGGNFVAFSVVCWGVLTKRGCSGSIGSRWGGVPSTYYLPNPTGYTFTNIKKVI